MNLSGFRCKFAVLPLVFVVSASVGVPATAAAQELDAYKLGPDSNTMVETDWLGLGSFDPNGEDLAKVQTHNEVAQGTGGDPEKCRALQADPNADVGVIIRAGCQPALTQMSKLMDNPLGNIAMLYTQFDWSRLKNEANGKEANQYLYTGIAQFPKKINKDWNLINRIVWTVPSLPIDGDALNEFSSGPGGGVIPPGGGGVAPIDAFKGRTTDFGDMYYIGLFAPEKGIDVGNGEKFLWGVGLDLSFPTATENVLGSGKWSAGPSALGVYMGKKWKIGALAQQYWSYAGPNDRNDVNLTNLQYLAYFKLDDTTSIGAAPNILANWEQDSDNRFTVPIGIGISKTIKIGKVPVRFGVEYHYSIIQPDDVPGTDWNIRFYIIPAIPSALFSWMN